MRVLRLIGGLDPRHGGPPVSALNSCIAAQRQGIETTLVYGLDPANQAAIAPALDRLSAEGVVDTGMLYTRILRETAESWGVCPALPRWLMANRRRFDIVHCHGAWQASALATLMLVATTGQPCVLTPHESLTEFDIAQSSRPLLRFVKRALQPTLLRGFDRVIVASEIEARDSEPPHIAGRVRFTVIPHAVSDERKGNAEPRVGLLCPGVLRVGFIGRLHPKKNVDLLVRALSALPANVTLAVAGDGPERDRLHCLAEQLSVAHRIEWLGFVEEDVKPAFFAGIDLLAMPSAYECFGVAVAEAMTAGVPVIVSAETGVANIVAQSGAGVIVATSVESIVAMLGSLVAAPEKLSAWSSQAITAAQSSFSFAAHGAALRRTYEALLAGFPRRDAKP